MGSLKLRLALANALLIAITVAIAVGYSLREVEADAESAIIDTNLGAAQIASTLSAAVVEHERAVAAAVGDWPQGLAVTPERVAEFVERHRVLRSLFNRLTILPNDGALASAVGGPRVSSPLRDLGGPGNLDVAIAAPIATGGGPRAVLAGMLSLRGVNFLSNIARAAVLDDQHIKTVVADQQGHILAHADAAWLMSPVDTQPGLREAVARWRSQGSPLEPTPSTERWGDLFVARAAVPGTEWMVFRIASNEVLFHEARRSVSRTIALGAGIALVGALCIFGLTAWLLGPLGVLRRRALRSMEANQAPQDGWPEGLGEIGELSRVLKHVSTQLAGSRADMERTLQNMQAVLEHAPVGIGFTHGARFELTNANLGRMLGYEAGTLDCEWEELLASDAPRDQLREEAESAFAAGRAFEAEIPLRRRDGSVLWAKVLGAAVQGASMRRIWVVVDATLARRQRESLEWSAGHDPLTNLVNRREFERNLAQLVDDRRRHEPACALFIDLDHFKQVNDGAGHAAGDAILLLVACGLGESVRSGDVVGRLGGDEFAVLLPACRLDQALAIAEKMRERVARDGICASDPKLRVTASIGVVEIGVPPCSSADVLDAADRACYAAKHAGRNAVRSAAVQTEGDDKLAPDRADGSAFRLL